MAAERQGSAPVGASAYDRIFILATSTTPAQVASTNPRGGAANNPGFGAAGTQRRVPPRPPNMPDTDEAEDVRDALEQEQANANAQPVFTFPSPPGGGPGSPNAPAFMPMNNGAAPAFGVAQPGMTQPVITLQPNANGQPTIYNFVPNAVDGTTQPQPTSGFGIVGSPTPGMVQQPPATPPPPGPRPPV
jgi:hypothetical protein